MRKPASFVWFFLLSCGLLWGSERITIQAASEFDYPPFCIVLPDGSADGFSVELMRASLAAVNRDVSFKTGEWIVIKNELRDGLIQALPLVGRTPEREAFYDFTFHYLTLNGAVFVRKGDNRIASAADLSDKTIGVMRGDNAEEYVRRVKLSSKIETFKGYPEAMQSLAEGKIDAVVCQRLMGIMGLKQNNQKGVEPLNFDLSDFHQDFCFAVKKGDTKLLELLNEGLSIVIADGTYDQLQEKWFGPYVAKPISKTEVALYVLAGVAVTGAMMSVLLIVLLRRQVRRKTDYLENLLNFANAPIIVWDPKFRTTRFNHAFEAITGRSETEVLGKSVEILFPPEKVQATMDLIRTTLTGERWETVEIEILHRDGSVRTLLWNSATLWAADGKTPIATIAQGQDISDRIHGEEERAKLEHQLNQQQKLESIGVLAGGIAHDFNNLLSGIFAYIELAAAQPNNEKVSRYLNKTLGTQERARDITRQLLTFSKGGQPIREVAPLAPFVREAVSFALSGSNVTCNYHFPDNLWDGSFDKNQLAQVVDNLVINALQAMPDGGSLTVMARNCHLEENQQGSLPAGNYLQLTVKDSGPGMTPEVAARAFDPFFTTKPTGHGLGLSTCYSIIRKHGGEMTLESKPGEGSTFHLFLPASFDHEISGNSTAVESHSGHGTILIMDDEEVVRDVLHDILESFGYTVRATSNGTEAVAAFAADRNARREIVAVILDFTVPGGMGGKEAVKHLRELDAEVPIFAASGYADDAMMADPRSYGFTGSLSKPFRKATLAALLEGA